MNESFEMGARNLLENCANTKAGQHILLVGERDDNPYFDPQLCDDVAKVAETLGASAEVILAEPVADAEHIPQTVSEAMQTADITIFFSRLGDQVRFVDTPGNGRKVMTYTLTRKYLESPFAGMNFKTMTRIHDRLLARIKKAESYRIEADNGTSLSACLQQTTESEETNIIDFNVELFPVMIFPPIKFTNLNGRLVIEDFVMSTSVHQYKESVLHLDSPVDVKIEDGRMVDFVGDQQLISRVHAQLVRAAAITGGDPYRINSWHTGINPYTFFDGNPYDHLERWGTVSYGSPGYTHFHAAGNDPGDVALHLMNASISFDNENFWERGKFVYLESPEIQELLGDEDRKLINSSIISHIGL
jgi:hypothetical protein